MARVRTSDAPRPPKARSDAYVGLLLLALLAQIAGAVFLYLDWSAYPQTAPPKVPTAPTVTQPATTPAGGQPQGGGQPLPMP